MTSYKHVVIVTDLMSVLQTLYQDKHFYNIHLIIVNIFNILKDLKLYLS